MAKRKKRTDFDRIRAQGHDEYVAAMRDGVRLRATTFADRGKVADKRAARGRTYRGEYA